MPQKRLPKKGVYVEFSKRVTMTALIGFFVALMLTLLAVSFLHLRDAEIKALESLIGTYATVVGVVISGYFARAGFDGWSAAKYDSSSPNDKTDDSVG